MLRQGRFSVPWHQRYFDWKPQHVETLLKDVALAAAEQRPSHFLGSVMLIKTRKKNKWNINDGQQRIITFLLICAWLFENSSASGDKLTESHMMRLLFDIPETHKYTLADARKLSPRVTPPQNDKKNFEALICGETVGANGKMTAAWKIIGDFLGGKKAKELADITDFILNKLLVVEILVGQGTDPNAIFEVLNHRGKKLESMDLIKNYIFSFFNDPESEQQRTTVLEKMEIIYNSFGGKVGIVSEYVRCHLQMELGFLRGGNDYFYDDVKGKIAERAATAPQKRQFVFDLVDKLAQKHRLQLFLTITQNSRESEYLQQFIGDSGSFDNNRKVYDYLTDLREYKIARPVIFALLCRYSEEKAPNKKRMVAVFANKGCKFLASYVQRVTHMEGGFKPSAYEVALAGLAYDIGNGKCLNKAQFKIALGKFPDKDLMSDSIYKERMSAVMCSTQKAKYILACIVEHEQPDISFRYQDPDITVEHILPQGEDYLDGWEEFTKDDSGKYIQRLGNLTILHRRDNKSGEEYNQNFAAKKGLYERCSYGITKELCRHDDWSPKAIISRQKKLAMIAAQIWDFQ